jgi:hypothetical protein
MLRSLLQLLRPHGEVVRGGPHFLIPPRRGVVAWIPEGRLITRAGRRIVVPTAIIELHATGVRRRRIGLLRRFLRHRRAAAR